MLEPQIPNSEFHFEEPRQNEIYDYLKRLVGEGTASFYKDACRLIITKPPFDSVTHIVGHLLREIESALRNVLKSIKNSNNNHRKKGEEHKNEIRLILSALEIPEDEQVAKVWLSLSGIEGLSGIAHRNNLEKPRPKDEIFQELWENINLILIVVLRKFETKYIRVFDTLDKLALKNAPTKEDVKKLKSEIPNNRVAHEHFFKTITSPLWLPLLEEGDFFKLPPKPEQDIENRSTRHPIWPVLIYLSKVAELSPEHVAKILSEIPNTENGTVQANLIEITTQLPIEKKLELMPHIEKWMNSGDQFFSSMKSIKLIESFGVKNEIKSALILSRYLLGFVPNKEDSHQEPITIIDKWQYSKFLEGEFFSIAQKDPVNALSLLCEILSKYYDISYIVRIDTPAEDYSYVKRPSIEKSEQIHDNDVDDSLINTILIVALDAIEKNPAHQQNIISELQNQKWPVFKRIALYVLSRYPNINPEFAIESLTNISILDNSNFEHEYSLLVDSAFILLSLEQRENIFSFIDKAESIKISVRVYHSSISDKDFEMWIKSWQRDKLSIFESFLNESAMIKYKKLIAELGKANNPRHKEGTKVFIGPVSDINTQRINQMSFEEIIEHLKTWQPKESDRGFGPSKEGLGRELISAIKNDASRFSALAKDFINLDPTYIRNYIQGFSEVIQSNIQFEWTLIIDLCLWVVEQPREISGRKEGNIFGEDPDWGGTRSAIIHLISNGLNHNSIPHELCKETWKIIEILSDDPDPTPQRELTREGAFKDNAFFITINSVRGEAITAVIEYGLWITRLNKKLSEEQKPKLEGFALLPEVQFVLEKHLTDPSIAIRAAYGRYLPSILYLSRDWTIAHLMEIFPDGGYGTPMYDAAWESYVIYNSPHNGVLLEALHNQYFEAVRKIGSIKKNGHFHNRDDKLVEHLMTFFWYGDLTTTNYNGLFATFWKTATDDARAHALEFIGHSLRSYEGPLEDKVSNVLKGLWVMRITEAEIAKNKKPYQKEMSTFGWWFASGKFDEDWSIREFLRSLDIYSKTNVYQLVIERLIELAESRPTSVIQILEKLLQCGELYWILTGKENNIRTIMTLALSSLEVEARKAARDLINRMIAWGYSNYSDLLSPNQF